MYDVNKNAIVKVEDKTYDYGQNAVLYVQNRSGLYRLNPGGSLWEKIVEGELCSLSLPDVKVVDLVEGDNEEFYMLANDGTGNFSILKYQCDPSIATLPEYELVVYTLEENGTVRLAAVEYQKLYPDTKISIQIAGGDDGVTTGDLLRVLNTELLAGKGPDILILDGMNVESYIDKGTLLDLSELMAELAAKSEMVEPVLRTYEKDDRIYAVPVKYHLPIMITEEKMATEVATLDDLVRYAVEHSERGIQGDLTPEALLAALMPASAPAWIADSAIDKEQLSSYLEAVHAIMSTGATSYPYEGLGYETAYVMDMERFHYAFGRSNAYLSVMDGVYDATGRFLPILESREDSVITYLPGQREKSFVIVEASTGYLTGEKSLEQAIADVEEATKLYLAE